MELADFVNGYWDAAKPWLLAKSEAAPTGSPCTSSAARRSSASAC